jgi:hypothetical protein
MRHPDVYSGDQAGQRQKPEHDSPAAHPVACRHLTRFLQETRANQFGDQVRNRCFMETCGPGDFDSGNRTTVPYKTEDPDLIWLMRQETALMNDIPHGNTLS